MIEMLRKRREDGEEGFTLIELMVVVLIIGILLAIAVPTFLSAQKNAKNKAATSNVRSALSAIKTIYAEEQAYSPMSKATLLAAEPSLDWVTTSADPSTGPQKISWRSVSATQLSLAALSKNNVCFTLFDDTGTGTTYGKTTGSSATTCIAPAAALSSNSTDAWKD